MVSQTRQLVGSIYVDDDAGTALTITTQNEWTELGFNATASGLANEVSGDKITETAADGTLTLPKAGLYEASWSASVGVASAAVDALWGGLVVGGAGASAVEVPGSLDKQTTVNLQTHMGVNGILYEAAEGAVIQPAFQNKDTTANLEVFALRLTAKFVG